MNHEEFWMAMFVAVFACSFLECATFKISKDGGLQAAVEYEACMRRHVLVRWHADGLVFLTLARLAGQVVELRMLDGRWEPCPPAR
jgi:hypothetical protein